MSPAAGRRRPACSPRTSPGLGRAGMTAAPARHHDGPPGAATTSPLAAAPPGEGLAGGPWRRYGWALAAIWLIELVPRPAALA